MRKIFISVNEAAEGMRIAETVYNDYGAIIVSINTILDDHIIHKLKNIGITRIGVFNETEEENAARGPGVFHAHYSENVEIIKDFLHDIAAGSKVDMRKVGQVSDSLYEKVNENRDIIGCLNSIRNADEYTYTHSVNVSLLAMLIAKWMKLSPGKVQQLIQTGLLHDIGKSKVSPDIIKKPGSLNSNEYEEMKKHPLYGYKLIANIPSISRDICMGVLMHHERQDGSGYPVGLKGSNIHPFARIISVADIYDAMTSNRSYHKKESPFEVFELMENNTFGVLGPVVVKTFLTNIASYYIGDHFKLSTGDTGEIVYINPMHISQPVIKVNDNYIDLTHHYDIKIQELIKW